ncbi:MAG: trehalose-phosphatase [Actinomycetota bacterium]
MEHALGKWPKLKEIIKTASSILLLLDLDGTLSPIIERPELTKIDGSIAAALKDLLAHPKITLGIISGRSIENLRMLMPPSLGRIILAGNHGLEISIGGNHFVHPAALQSRSILRRTGEKLKKRFSDFSGVIVEDKGLTLSLHYRLAEPQRVPEIKNIFKEVTEPLVKDGRIRIRKCKKVLEVRPPVSWDKGKAVEWIAQVLKVSNALPIYAGDDATDEDVFRILKGRGISIYVGRPRGSSAAKYYLENVEQVRAFLRRLRSALSNGQEG